MVKLKGAGLLASKNYVLDKFGRAAVNLMINALNKKIEKYLTRRFSQASFTLSIVMYIGLNKYARSCIKVMNQQLLNRR